MPGERLWTKLNDFWPEYLSHHRHATNRAFHDLADLIVIGFTVVGIATGSIAILGAGIATGYAMVFSSHWLVEKNRPATLGHPILAGISNWRMFALMASGRLDAEFEKYGIQTMGSAPWGVDAVLRRIRPSRPHVA